MNMPYLFSHFREKNTPDGEQVYFAISRNGIHWDAVNNGCPVLICTKGEKGCRDIEIARLHTGGFVIIATDLCLALCFDKDGNIDWNKLSKNGSKYISMWKSQDLIHFSGQELISFGRDDFGCIWAPEVFFDENNDEYIIHFSATVKSDNDSHMAIYYTKTSDFIHFTYPQLFFKKENDVLDSHIVKIGDKYHLFYKNSAEPLMNMHAYSDELFGKYIHDNAFEKYMSQLYRPGSYEASTTYILPDGKWCLMMDFFGCEKDKMGYVPFISPKAGNADFKMSKENFTFPYGFKHGRVIEITQSEYDSIKGAYKK